MNTALQELIDVLELEPIAENTYRGKPLDIGLSHLYGGHILAQCLAAAINTVESTRQVHSLHGYFLRPGNVSDVVLYKVNSLRDGKSFSARQVQAIQQGEMLFTALVSLQQFESGFSHQCAMPVDIPAPEQLKSLKQLYEPIKHFLPEQLRQRVLIDGAIEMRPVVAIDILKPAKIEPIQHIWFKINGQLSLEPQSLHSVILTYLSDFNLLGTSLQPHGVSIFQPSMQVASIDHSLHFHQPVNVNDWLLYSLNSPWSGNGRGFSQGRIFNRQGLLVASSSQEGVIRFRTDKIHK